MGSEVTPEVSALAINVTIPEALRWTDTRRGEAFTLTTLNVRLLPNGHLAAKAYGRPTGLTFIDLPDGTFLIYADGDRRQVIVANTASRTVVSRSTETGTATPSPHLVAVRRRVRLRRVRAGAIGLEPDEPVHVVAHTGHRLPVVPRRRCAPDDKRLAAGALAAA
jgi:hypothetical protein